MQDINIHWRPFIGKKIEVKSSKNNSLLNGTIVDETKFSFTLKTNGSLKKVLKKDSIFEIENVTITGNSIIGRCDQRLKKK